LTNKENDEKRIIEELSTKLEEMKKENDETLFFFNTRLFADRLAGLVEKGDVSIEILIRSLENYEDNARWVIIRALGILKTQKAIEPLIICLKDESFRISREAAIALGMIGNLEAIRPLVVWFVLAKESWKYNFDTLNRFNAVAVEAIRDMEPREESIKILQAVIGEEKGDIRRAAIFLLGTLKETKVLEIFIDLIKQDKDIIVRKIAILALSRFFCDEARAIKAIVTALSEDDSYEIQVEAARVTKDSTVLIKTLEDKDYDYRVRREAAWGLAKLKDPTSVVPLINILNDNEEDNEVRSSVASSLCRLGDERAIDALENAIKDPEIGSGIIHSLPNLEHPRIAEILIKELENENARMTTIVNILGELRDLRAARPLASILEDQSKDDELRNYAANSLHSTLHYTLSCKEEIDTVVVSLLIKTMQSEQSKESSYHKSYFQEKAVLCLSCLIEDSEAFRALINALKEHESSWVRLEIARLLDLHCKHHECPDDNPLVQRIRKILANIKE